MAEPVQAVIDPRASDIGGFQVRRALPSAKQRTVGPFVFYDEMGPAMLGAGSALDVAPHPHIGLATVTYLFSGEILHRDSLGSEQLITPGAVNWMTAGRGIVHSERTPPERRAQPHSLSGIQVWVGLPRAHEETEPAFAHHPAATLPLIESGSVSLRLIAGSLFGERAPVETFSEMFYADAMLDAGATLELSTEHEERAVHVVEGEVEIGGARFAAGAFVVLTPGEPVTLHAEHGARFMLLGGAPLDGHRHVWWNFVSSSRERIEQAKQDWREDRFARVPGETGSIPLPGETTGPVNYP